MKSHTVTLALLASAVALTGCSTTATHSPRAAMTKEAQAAITPDQALDRLKAGNERFASGRSVNRNLRSQMKATAAGQYPFATVVSCVDSRTSTELIFDQGIGDVFNARIAGNVVNPDIVGSLEFAVAAAGSKLIAVVGHTACGAVKGACDDVKLGNLTGLLDRIDPALARTRSAPGEKRTSKNAAFVDRVAETNVRLTMAKIRSSSPTLRQHIAEGKVAVVGGMYDIETGRVSWLQ